MISEAQVTPKTVVMAAENSSWHQRNKLHFIMNNIKCIKIDICRVKCNNILQV